MIRALSILLASALAAGAAERITLTLTVTNPPVTSNTLVVNANSRYWTNSSSASTIATNLVGKNEATTNLFNQIAAYPYSGGISLSWNTTNSLRLVGSLGGALAASASGTWATLTLTTQSGPQTYTALWPLENMVGATNRTNEASALVYGLSTYSTQAYATNATAVSNLLQKGAGPLQRVDGPVLFNNAALTNGSITRASVSNLLWLSGIVGALTNGYWTNGTAVNLTVTNLSSPGSGSGSQQFGSGSSAAGANSLAMGVSAVTTNASAVAVGISANAGGNQALSIGASSKAKAPNDIAIGEGAYADGAATGGGLALGAEAVVTAYNGIAIGSLASSAFTNAVAIGAAATTTATNQIMLGTSAFTVNVPGQLQAASQTNSVLRGTNVINGRVDFTSRANTGLANGNNSGVVLGTNVYVRLSGATTIAAIAGFAAEQDGSFHILEISGAITNTFLNQSGVDATAANRIVTGTGADISITNNPTVISIIYNATDSRWKMFFQSRTP